MAFSCSAFVRRYLAIPCYSNHTMRYKAAGGCSCTVPPPPPSSSSSPSSSFSLHHIISHLNRILAEWSRGRWKWSVHRPLTILRPREATCRLCSFSLRQARLNSVPGRGRRLVKTVSRELCHVVSFFFSHPRSLSLPCEVRPRSKTWKPELFSFLDCGATLDLSECCK